MGVGEDGTGGSERIEIWRQRDRVPEEPDVTPGVVVSDDEDDIRWYRCRHREGRRVQREQGGEDQTTSAGGQA